MEENLKLRKMTKNKDLEKKLDEEDLFSSPLLYAVKFSEDDDERGGCFMIARIDHGVSLLGYASNKPLSIYVMDQEDLRKLEKTSLKYEYYPIKDDPEEIYKYFNISRNPETPIKELSLLEILLLKLKVKFAEVRRKDQDYILKLMESTLYDENKNLRLKVKGPFRFH